MAEAAGEGGLGAKGGEQGSAIKTAPTTVERGSLLAVMWTGSAGKANNLLEKTRGAGRVVKGASAARQKTAATSSSWLLAQGMWAIESRSHGLSRLTEAMATRDHS